MKQSPEMQKIEEMLRSSRLVAGGFLGPDPRSLVEIIESDLSELEGLGYTTRQIAERMRELTGLSRPRFGGFVSVGETLQVATEEHRGTVVCPWPHLATFQKTETVAKQLDIGQEIRWSSLSIHLIESHHFFQGKGSHFRLEPSMIIRIIF